MFKVQPDPLDLLDSPAQLVPRVPRALLVFKVPRDRLVQPELVVLLDQLVQQD